MEFGHVRINYKKQGSGRPVVLIHGAAENLSFWKEQVAALGKLCQVLSIDLPGHGESSRMNEEPTIDTYAALVRDFSRSLALKGCVYVGHSMGGAIALKLALDYSSEIAGTVLANTGAKLGVLPEILSGLRSDPERTFSKIIMPMGLPQGSEVSKFVVSESLRCSSEQALQDFWACNMFDVRNRLGEIRVRCLVIGGGMDKLAPRKWADFLKQKIPNSRLVLVEDSYHYTMLENPAKFNAALTDFLATLSKD